MAFASVELEHVLSEIGFRGLELLRGLGMLLDDIVDLSFEGHLGIGELLRARVELLDETKITGFENDAAGLGVVESLFSISR